MDSVKLEQEFLFCIEYELHIWSLLAFLVELDLEIKICQLPCEAL